MLSVFHCIERLFNLMEVIEDELESNEKENDKISLSVDMMSFKKRFLACVPIYKGENLNEDHDMDEITDMEVQKKNDLRTIVINPIIKHGMRNYNPMAKSGRMYEIDTLRPMVPIFRCTPRPLKILSHTKPQHSHGIINSLPNTVMNTIKIEEDIKGYYFY